MNESDLAKLAKELRDITGHDRAEEIFANEWLYDGSLPVPSVELVRFLAAQCLDAKGFLAYASNNDLEACIKFLVSIIRECPDKELHAQIVSENDFTESERLRLTESGKSTRMHEWEPIIGHFLYAESDGQRAVAKHIMEVLLLRAAFHFDVEAIRSLADALELRRKNEFAQCSPSQRIASEILNWKLRLTLELGRLPSKSEMKTFLMRLYPYLPDPDKNPKQWSAAWRLTRWPSDGDRKGERSKAALERIEKIAERVIAE